MALHIRLGHIGFDRLLILLKLGKSRGLGTLDMSKDDLAKARDMAIHCNACREGKSTSTPHSNSGTLNHGNSPGEVVHIDTN